MKKLMFTSLILSAFALMYAGCPLFGENNNPFGYSVASRTGSNEAPESEAVYIPIDVDITDPTFNPFDPPVPFVPNPDLIPTPVTGNPTPTPPTVIQLITDMWSQPTAPIVNKVSMIFVMDKSASFAEEYSDFVDATRALINSWNNIGVPMCVGVTGGYLDDKSLYGFTDPSGRLYSRDGNKNNACLCTDEFADLDGLLAKFQDNLDGLAALPNHGVGDGEGMDYAIHQMITNNQKVLYNKSTGCMQDDHAIAFFVAGDENSLMDSPDCSYSGGSYSFSPTGRSTNLLHYNCGEARGKAAYYAKLNAGTGKYDVWLNEFEMAQRLQDFSGTRNIFYNIIGYMNPDDTTYSKQEEIPHGYLETLLEHRLGCRADLKHAVNNNIGQFISEFDNCAEELKPQINLYTVFDTTEVFCPTKLWVKVAPSLTQLENPSWPTISAEEIQILGPKRFKLKSGFGEAGHLIKAIYVKADDPACN